MEQRNFEIRLLCCGGGEGELCPCMDKYRGKEITTQYGYTFRPVDLLAWMNSKDFVGYYALPKGSEDIDDETRKLIAEGLRRLGIKGLTTFVGLPGVKVSGDWKDVVIEWDDFVDCVQMETNKTLLKEGMITLNQARASIGLDPVEGGDTSLSIRDHQKSTPVKGWRPSLPTILGGLALAAVAVRNRD